MATRSKTKAKTEGKEAKAESKAPNGAATAAKSESKKQGNKKHGRDEETKSAKGEPAAKRKDAGVQFVVTRSEHTDCYKRGSTDTEVEEIFASEKAAVMHCLPRNVMHYCTNRREDGVQIIGEIIEGWMPDEQFKALKAELEQWLQDGKPCEYWRNQEVELEGDKQLDAWMKKLIDSVPEGKLAELHQNVFEILESQPGEYTEREDGTLWSYTKKKVKG